jgi:galactoside O-acetyltransferase
MVAPELARAGFFFGKDVRVSRHARIVGNPANLRLGNRVRIDDFVQIVANGPIEIGDNVHVGNHSSLHGGGGIKIGDGVRLSAGVRIFSVGENFLGPPGENLEAHVEVGDHCIIGTNSVLLPGSTMLEGSTLGAGSILPAGRTLEAWRLHAGVPPVFISDRKRER